MSLCVCIHISEKKIFWVYLVEELMVLLQSLNTKLEDGILIWNLWTDLILQEIWEDWKNTKVYISGNKSIAFVRFSKGTMTKSKFKNISS